MTARSRRTALAITTLLLFVGAAWMAGPLWIGLVLGMTMAFAAQPLHALLVRRTHGRRSVSAAITTLLGGLTMIAGAGVAVFVVARQIASSLAAFQQKLGRGSLSALVGDRATNLLSKLGIKPSAVVDGLQGQVGRISGDAAQTIGLVVEKTTGLVLMVVVALITMYYVLVDWPRLTERLERILPLDPRDTRALTGEFREVGRAAIVATVASAMVQGALATLGFAIARVPEPWTWGTLLAITSFVPVVGTALVWIPVGIYLMERGHMGWGLFDFAWGTLVVMALTDYVIRPYLAGARGHTHPLLAIVSLVGGVIVLGLPGLIVGPMVMSLFVAALRIYEDLGRADPGP